MIESLSNLINESGAQQINIIVRTDNNENVTVILNTILQATEKGETEQALKLRAALSQPIIVKGNIGDVDVEITQALSQYTDTYVDGAQKHLSILDVKSNIEQASKSVKTKTTKAANKPDESHEIEVDDVSSTETEIKIEVGQENHNEPNFESGNIESL